MLYDEICVDIIDKMQQRTFFAQKKNGGVSFLLSGNWKKSAVFLFWQDIQKSLNVFIFNLVITAEMKRNVFKTNKLSVSGSEEKACKM